MDKFTKLKNNVAKMYTKCNLELEPKDKSKIIEHTALYIDSIIFKIVSIMYICSLSSNNDKITEQILENGKQYVNTNLKSNKMSGGSRLGSATFLGINESMYDAKNPTNDILPVNFEDCTARPQIGGGYAIDTSFKKLMMSYITDILKYHDIKASKNVKEQMQHMVMLHVKNLFMCIASKNQKVKLSFVKKTIKEQNLFHESKKDKK